MKIEIEGTLSAGYYNSMEATEGIYIDDGTNLEELIKGKLIDLGRDESFSYAPFEDASYVKNPLVGKKVKVTVEIEE